LLQARFACAFERALRAVSDATLGFPHVFTQASAFSALAAEEAQRQWEGWIEGGYGVCLRRFSAEAVVTKISARAKIKLLVSEKNASPIELVEEMARLEAVLLPFSPLERATGTPGWAIDEVLLGMGCGQELEAQSF
jgi:hypothetical protein